MTQKTYQQNDCQSLLIRDMATDDRPREKALKHGFKSLTNAELLALLFATGLKGKSVMQLSEEILRDNRHHLSILAKLSIKDFMNRYKGIGQAKAITVLAALELGSRAAADAASIDRPAMTSPQLAADSMRHHFSNLPHEEFWVMLLDQGAHVIKECCVARGGISATVVDIKVVLKLALENYAVSMILFHNHPSGTLRPSDADDRLTKRICKGAAAVDIRVNDHVIVTDGSYYSYHENGRMPDISTDF